MKAAKTVKKAQPKAAAKAKPSGVKKSASKPAKKPIVKPVEQTTPAVAEPVAKQPVKLTVSGLQIKLSDSLTKEILDRSKQAFDKVDSGADMKASENHVTRCHKVEQNQLAYRLPAEARTVPGQAVIVTRTGKGERMKIKITDDIVDGFKPVLGWPSSYGIKD